MRNKYLWTGIVIIITALINTSCYDSTGKTLNDMPVNVEVKKVSNIDGSQTIEYSGTIEESELIPLSFSTIGNVSRVYVSEGDFVRKGQLLAELNNETYKNAYEMSLATFKQAEDAYNRLNAMYKNGNLPEIKLVEVETGLQQAKSSTLIAKKNLDDCKLYSTVDGIVGTRSIDPGMNAMPTFSSITLVKIQKVFANVSISENEIPYVKNGDKAKINIAALNHAEFLGKVEEIGVIANPIAHTYKVKIGIANNNRQIKPGMTCNVALNKHNDTDGLFVPGNAVLVDEQGRNFVFTVAQNKATRKYVKTGKLLKDGVEIISGLNHGEQIVVSGQQKLVDNSLVNVVN